LGFCEHKILPLISQEHYPGDFFKHDGIFFLPDILEKLTGIISKKQTLDEENGILFQWTQDKRFLEIFILPEKNYLIKTFKYEDANIPLGGIKSYIYRVKEIQKNNDAISPKIITIQRELQGGKGKRDGLVFSIQGQKYDEEIVIDKINYKPKFHNSDFVSSIHDGTQIYMQDAPQIQYVWMDGKPVLKTDEVALAIARGGHKFIPEPDEPRFWMMALGIIMMLVGGGWKLRDMLKKS
jgi:hypothetical protein